MTQKDLADEYAEKEYHRVNGDDAPCFTDEPCFNFDDIRYAFNAGRESVVENMPSRQPTNTIRNKLKKH